MASRKDPGQQKKTRNLLITFRNMATAIGEYSQRMLVCHISLQPIKYVFAFCYLSYKINGFCFFSCWVGLQRCGKSCRLRWTNYLRPDIKRGRFTFEEEETIIQLHSILGNKWVSCLICCFCQFIIHTEQHESNIIFR